MIHEMPQHLIRIPQRPRPRPHRTARAARALAGRPPTRHRRRRRRTQKRHGAHQPTTTAATAAALVLVPAHRDADPRLDRTISEMLRPTMRPLHMREAEQGVIEPDLDLRSRGSRLGVAGEHLGDEGEDGGHGAEELMVLCESVAVEGVDPGADLGEVSVKRGVGRGAAAAGGAVLAGAVGGEGGGLALEQVGEDVEEDGGEGEDVGALRVGGEGVVGVDDGGGAGGGGGGRGAVGGGHGDGAGRVAGGERGGVGDVAGAARGGAAAADGDLAARAAAAGEGGAERLALVDDGRLDPVFRGGVVVGFVVAAFLAVLRALEFEGADVAEEDGVGGVDEDVRRPDVWMREAAPMQE